MKLIGFVVNFLCIWLLGMNLANAEKFSLVELSNYFNKLDTFQANFRQFSDDGSEAKGVIQIKKPGRLRIDYEEPEDLLILGSGGRLAIFDPKGDPEPTSFPLNLTPFSLVLENSINFVGSSNILLHDFNQGETSLSLYDPKHPERGYTKLIFSGNKPVLSRWIIQDESGSTTLMSIERYEENIALGEMQFNIQLEIESRRN